MRTTASAALVLCLVLGLTGSASADLTVPGQRIIKVECDLEFGPYEDYSARKYTVVKGDTLEKIAANELGKAARWREITSINDAIDHKALKVGQVLWIPAAKSTVPADRSEREAPVAAPRDWWQFYAAPGGGHFGNWIERIAHGERVPYHHYYTTVIAVRSDQIAAFQKALADRGDVSLSDLLKTWQSKSGFAIADTTLPGRSSVNEASAEASRIETWRVTKIEGHAITVKKAQHQRLDRSGEEVRRMSGFFGVNGLLLALGFVALAGLVVLVRRRKAVAENA